MKVGIIKIVGLFSVPAPPFRFAASGGVFLLDGRRHAMPHTTWQSIGYAAALQCNELCAAANLTRPREGLTDVVVAGQRLSAARLLGIATSSTADVVGVDPLENYVRGADLVVAYEESGERLLRVDALWRATAPAAADKFLAAVDLIVSVRTGLLDSHPELPVETTVPSREVLRLQSLAPAAWTPLPLTTAARMTIGADGGEGCLLFRLPGSDLSYVEMVHPADFQQDDLSRNDILPSPASERGAGGEGELGGAVLRIAHRLFRTSLEKGVILRARVRGIFMRRRDDTKVAAACYAAFAAAEPPLGT